MKLLYIKAGGVKYCVLKTNYEFGVKGVRTNCSIKKRFGIYRVDYYHPDGDRERKRNTRILLYPSGIEEIKYEL